jgi:hypothetical protein
MIRSTLLAAIATLSVALCLTVQIEERRVNEERARAAALALHASNVSAERDSTRDVAAGNRKVAALLGDSLRLVEKQVVQAAQRSDALDRALGRERRARYVMSATVDSLQRVAFAAPVGDSTDSVRRASFALRQEPYTIAADVEIPQRPDSARLSVRVALDPIHVDARVTCSAPNDAGIRSASVVAATPSWASVRFDRVEQSPELCASPALARPARARRGFGLAPVVIGAGRTWSPSGIGSWGFFVGIGATVRG